MMLRSKWLSAFLCASGIIIAALPANAGWKKVGTDGISGDSYYYDNARVMRNDNTVRYWQKTTLPREDYNGVKSIRSQMEGDCLLSQTRTLEVVAYNARGKKIGHEVSPGSTQIALPGTYGEYILQQVCAAR
jgi:hypothetical protein